MPIMYDQSGRAVRPPIAYTQTMIDNLSRQIDRYRNKIADLTDQVDKAYGEGYHDGWTDGRHSDE